MDRDQSEFNDSVGYLNRINALFYMADDASINMDTHKWFVTLLALYRELSTEMTSKELDYAVTRLNQINPMVNKVSKEFMRTGQVSINNELYLSLNEFEIWLRKIYKDAGLQIKIKDSPEFALQ